MLEFNSIAEMQSHYKAVRDRVRFNEGYTRRTPDPPPKPKLQWWTPRIESVFTPRELALFAILREGPAGKAIRRSFPPIPRIKRVVCGFYGVTLIDLISERRQVDIMRPRQVAYYLCRELTPLSFPRIGAEFGGRDHTSILSGYRKIKRLIPTDPVLAQELVDLRNALGIEAEQALQG